MTAAVHALGIGGCGDWNERRAERGGKNEDTHFTLLIFPHFRNEGENERTSGGVA
jgi:hypothetical protein